MRREGWERSPKFPVFWDSEGIRGKGEWNAHLCAMFTKLLNGVQVAQCDLVRVYSRYIDINIVRYALCALTTELMSGCASPSMQFFMRRTH